MEIAVGKQLAHPSATASSHQHHLNHTAKHTGASRDTYQSCWGETVHNSRWNFQSQLKSVFTGHFLAYSPKNTACFYTSQSMTIPLTYLSQAFVSKKRRKKRIRKTCAMLSIAASKTWHSCYRGMGQMPFPPARAVSPLCALLAWRSVCCLLSHPWFSCLCSWFCNCTLVKHSSDPGRQLWAQEQCGSFHTFPIYAATKGI